MKLVGFNAGKVATRSLRGTDGPELGNKLVSRGLFQSSELMAVGVGDVLEVEWAGNAVLERVCCGAMSWAHEGGGGEE